MKPEVFNYNDYTEVKSLLVAVVKKCAAELDICSVCSNYVKCEGEKCPKYECGIGAVDTDGNRHPNFKWSCEDWDFGECEVLESTPCHGCLSGNYSGFVLDMKKLKKELKEK